MSISFSHQKHHGGAVKNAIASRPGVATIRLQAPRPEGTRCISGTTSMTFTLRAIAAGAFFALSATLSVGHAAETAAPVKDEAPAVAPAPAPAQAAPAAAPATPPAAPAKTSAPAKPAKPAAPAAAKPAAAADSTKVAPVPGVPAPKALPPEIAGECAWTGKRLVGLLARDDVDQAKRFLEFYRLFDCKESHLAVAFRCVIVDDGTANEEFTNRVDRCWEAFN